MSATAQRTTLTAPPVGRPRTGAYAQMATLALGFVMTADEVDRSTVSSPLVGATSGRHR